jgi:RimJ/RimL family protein N-acetyltransferase
MGIDMYDLAVQNDKLILRNLIPEDKEDYYKLYQDTSIIKKKMKPEAFRRFFEKEWEQEILSKDRLNISILSADSKQYVGNILLRYLDSDMPEIGIDIVQEFRRKGFAYSAIQLFLKSTRNLFEKDKFLVRIYSDNIASLELFQKLGVSEIGREPSEYQIFLNELKEKFGDEYQRIKEMHPEMEEIASKRYIKRFCLSI